MQIQLKSLIDNRPFVLSCIFLICVAFGILSGFIFKTNDHDGSALAANIKVINNDQTVTVDESTGNITIGRDSEVKVTNPQSTNGYALSAKIHQNNIPNATATAHPKNALSSGSTSPCTESSPCPLSSDTNTSLLTTSNSAVNGDTTVWTITVTVPSGTPIGGYLFDIAYSEDFIACSSGGGIQSCIVDVDEGMIPVTYTGTIGSPSWAKADTSASQSKNWYNYDIHLWANAVTVTTATLQTYKDAPAGTNIPEADIMGYWVYIPRYAYEVQRYSIENDAIPEQTPWNIKFQKDTDPILNATPNNEAGSLTEKENVGNKNRWQPHPAFITEAGQLNGIWIGKYETGDSWGFCSHDGNAYCGTSYIGNERSARARIKPDISPMTMQRIAYQYQTATGMGTSHNLGGRISVTKDSEWAAATYLSNSRYGIYASFNTANPASSPAYFPKAYGSIVPATNKVYNNMQCTSADSCTSTTTPTSSLQSGALTITGHGPTGTVESPTESPTSTTVDADSRYYTLRGMLASTTHNIWGIYDMAGGVWENQMGAYTSTNGLPYTGNSATCNSGFLFGGQDALYGANTTNCGTAANNTSPSIAVNGSGSPWYYKAPTGGTTLGTKASSRQFDIYDQRQFTNNHYFTNYNQCEFLSCGGRGLMEVLNKHKLETNDSSLGWNGDSTYFVDTTGLWGG